jgi:hypothetical protein
VFVFLDQANDGHGAHGSANPAMQAWLMKVVFMQK